MKKIIPIIRVPASKHFVTLGIAVTNGRDRLRYLGRMKSARKELNGDWSVLSNEPDPRKTRVGRPKGKKNGNR